MVEPLDLESRIWSERGTKPAPGDEIYRPGYQPIAGYDNWANWSITTDLHNLRDQVGGLDDVYYRQSIADSLFYARHEADDRFLDADGDTAAQDSDYYLPDANIFDVEQIRRQGDTGVSTGVRLMEAGEDVIYLSDGRLPAGDRSLFNYNPSSSPTDTVVIGSAAVPRIELQGDELDLNDLTLTDSSSGPLRINRTPVRFYTEDADGNAQAVAEITANGDLRISGAVDSNYSF